MVLGGAYTPSTKIDTSVFNNIDCKSFDSYDFASPHSSLSPIAFLGRHLVVSGGVLATTNTHLNHSIDTLALCGTFLVRTHRIFRPQPSRPPFTDPICSVVPSRFWLWPRSGVGYQYHILVAFTLAPSRAPPLANNLACLAILAAYPVAQWLIGAENMNPNKV